MATQQLGEIGGNVVKRNSSGGVSGTYAVAASPVSAPKPNTNVQTRDTTTTNNSNSGVALGRTDTGGIIRSDGKGGVYIDNSQAKSSLSNVTPSATEVTLKNKLGIDKNTQFVEQLKASGYTSSGGRGGGASQPQSFPVQNLNPSVIPQPQSNLRNVTPAATAPIKTATFIEGTKPDANGNYYPSGFITSDGQFIESKSDANLPKGYEYATYKNQPEKYIYNAKGEVIGVESKYFGKSMTIEEYNKEIERIKKVTPQEKYYSPQYPNKTYDTDQAVLVDGVKLIDLTPVKIFVDPNTGQPINDINKYITDNKLPIQDNNLPDLYNYLNTIRGPQTYDLQNIPKRYYADYQVNTTGDTARLDESISSALQVMGASDKNIDLLSSALVMSNPSSLLLNKEGKEAATGFSQAILTDIRDRPIENLALYGLGEIVGFTISGAKVGYKLIPKNVLEEIKLGSRTAVEEIAPLTTKIITKGVETLGGTEALIRGGTIGLGIGIIGIQLSNVIKQELNPMITMKERGGIIGNVIKDNVIFIKGINKGSSAFEKIPYGNYVNPPITTGLDQIQPISSEGRMINLGAFKIEANIPEQIIYEDMPIKKYFRDLGIDNKYTGLKVVKRISPYRVISKGQIIMENGKIIYGQAVTGKAGSKSITVSFLQGEQGELNINDLSKYTKIKTKVEGGGFVTLSNNIQKYLIEKSLGPVLSKEEGLNYYQGLLRTTKSFKVDIEGNRKPFPTGKKSNIYSTVSMVKEIEELGVEGQYTAYETKLGLKDITNPNARARGKVIEISGFSKVHEPIVIDEDVSDYYVKRFNKDTKGGSTSKPITEQIAKLDTQKTVSILQSSKANIIDTIKVNSKNNYNAALNKVSDQLQEFNRIAQLPTYVGGKGKESGYKTNTMELPKYTEEYKYLPLSLSINNQSNPNNIKSLSFERELTKPYSSEINKTNNREINREINKELNKEINKEITKELQKNTQKQLQKQVIKQINKTNPLSPPFNPNNRITTKEPPIPPFKSSVLENFNKSNVGYLTFVKLKGKEVFLPGIRTKGEAERYGERYTLSNLRATFGVKPTGYKVNQPQTNYNVRQDLFRNYKIKGGKKISLQDTYIQRRGKRLYSRGEISELQTARYKNKR